MAAALVLDRWVAMYASRTSRARLTWLAAIAFAISLVPGSASVQPEFAPGASSLTPVVSLLQLPLPAQALVSQTLGEGDAAYHVRGLRARNPVQRLTATFAPAGVTVRAGRDRLRLALSGAPVEPVATLNRVEYRRKAVTEWYANGPLGLEQGFTVRRPLGGPLRLAVSGTLTPRLVGRDVVFGDSLKLRGLYAEDADRRALSVRFGLAGGALLIHVDDRGARYPITVDPFIQQTRVTAPDGMHDDQFGTYNALALDGDTMVVGAPLDDTGATFYGNEGSVYVFVRSGTGWTWQAKLTAPDPSGDQIGYAVAISGDTLVVGDPARRDTTTSPSQGAVFVFVRTGTTWSQQAELVAPDKVVDAGFGRSVAINGDTLVAGALPATGDGLAYVFTRTANTWAEQAELVASGVAEHFQAVDISGDTVVAGSPNDASQGSVYVFVRSGGTWSQQAKLSNPNPVGPPFYGSFGNAVAIAGDTMVVGRYADSNRDPGEAYVFVRHGDAWTGQARLASSTPAPDDEFGHSVDIIGNTAIVGADDDHNTIGAAFVFVRTGVVWTERAKLTANDAAGGDYLGASVAATADMLAAGVPTDDTPRGLDTGSVYTFPFADSDGDGLPDSWETDGLDANGDGTIDVDLPAMGADPDHKDVFVEIDSMTGHKLSQQALNIVIAAFAAAPVSNPDGTTGITLHIDNGPTSVMDPVTGATWGSLSDADTLAHVALLGTEPGGNYDWTAFDALADANFQSARERVFHYAISAHDFTVQNNSGIADIGGSYLIIALGSFCTTGGDCSGTVKEQAGTFMHELGHNLGLRHGGGDDLNNKPNYFSVMNYDWQFTGLIPVGTQGPGIFDYSHFGPSAVDPIDETTLDETKTFGHDAALGYWAAYRCPYSNPSGQPPWGKAVGTDPLGPVDWNCDGDSTDTGLAADVNGDGSQGTLNPFDDWSHIIYNGGSVGALGEALPAKPTQTEVTEPTKDQLLAAAALFGGGPPAATMTVTKVVVPSTDPGVFDLKIDGDTVAEGGDGTTSGPVPVDVGVSQEKLHTVSEAAGAGTDLAQYTSSIACAAPGRDPVTGGTVLVKLGDAWTCTITNTRKPSTGSLTISKTVDGGGSGFTSGSFAVNAACTGDPNSPYQRTIAVPAPGAATITGIPAGAVCTVTETSTPTPPTGYTWGTPTIDGPATIPAGGEAHVSVTNVLAAVPATSTTSSTKSTCSTFRDGKATQVNELVYQVRKNEVKSVTPSGILFWSKLTAPGSAFTLGAVDLNNAGWKSMDAREMNLWTAACGRVKTGKLSYDGNGNPVLTVSGATAGATYYVSTQYDASSLAGQPVQQPYPTVDYTFVTMLNGSPAAGPSTVATRFGT